jgi:hypothetical protein
MSSAGSYTFIRGSVVAGLRTTGWAGIAAADMPSAPGTSGRKATSRRGTASTSGSGHPAPRGDRPGTHRLVRARISDRAGLSEQVAGWVGPAMVVPPGARSSARHPFQANGIMSPGVRIDSESHRRASLGRQLERGRGRPGDARVRRAHPARAAGAGTGEFTDSVASPSANDGNPRPGRLIVSERQSTRRPWRTPEMS